MNKRLYIVFTILIIALIYISADKSFLNKGLKSNCLFTREGRIVQGTSFSPYIKPGAKIEALFGYYDCHAIKRNDIILFNYKGNKNPLLKVVKGIPGDKFELKKETGGWRIVVNNKILRNFENEPYLISGNRYKMLSLYEKSYQGRIPENAYLLLSNKVSGSIDSTVFGLVDKYNIIAKVDL